MCTYVCVYVQLHATTRTKRVRLPTLGLTDCRFLPQETEFFEYDDADMFLDETLLILEVR